MLRVLMIVVAVSAWLSADRLDATIDRAASVASRQDELWHDCPTSQLEATLFRDAADGHLEQHSRISAALIASGASDATELANHIRRLDEWLDRLPRDVADVRGQRPLAEALLRHLHDDLLTGRYRASSSDLRELVTDGDYNCVGAAIMYLAACERCGLVAAPQEMPGHVRCRVWIDGHWTAVEPTCRDWFAVLADEQQLQRLDVPAELRAAWRDPSQGRVLNTTALVAMIYYNHGLDRLEARDWSGAVAANQKALRLDPSSRAARANLLAIWNNWALQHSADGKHETAVEMLQHGLRLAPEFTTFQLNLGIVKQRKESR